MRSNEGSICSVKRFGKYNSMWIHIFDCYVGEIHPNDYELIFHIVPTPHLSPSAECCLMEFKVVPTRVFKFCESKRSCRSPFLKSKYSLSD
uniref:Uncharacterized protein n=1 Tax=Lepeophtheirus salmonis TaxID=72036 RepID=A0A0K2T3K8_LEPSM